ncbi:hypothetical protein [Vreelandella zhaodongensis]|uniref:Uncharacterized protein n=1 Tax=Vreelandella zhaodongensis TaxID=1176240 RepID=A0ABX2SU66_VREZH|nr:hypothetical protein [Halomonas zhaodongensis]NYS45574.1 hypothetical protein [Halomonas zhaodongensis]
MIEVTGHEESVWGIQCSPSDTMGLVMRTQMCDPSASESNLPGNLPPAARHRFLDILSANS